MTTDAINRLEYLCNTIPALLTSIHNDTFSEKVSPDKWSKKEIIGHLIDSATNNHQRFVRVQFEDSPRIAYDQNRWNKYNFYQQIDGQQIIDFWTAYNRQILELIRRIPNENLKLVCRVGDSFLTLDFLINDYVEHLEHHLKQVVSY
ncbi:MAG: DinB family protein [Flavihumibacter sp.]|nr:DinB family protein [Flavihumibacter sp.]